MGAILLLTLIAYVSLTYMIAHRVKSPGTSSTHFFVAGRRLGFWLSTGTLFATWFGAGTVIAVSNAVYEKGIHKALLIPFGAGLCLIVVSFFYAEKIWAAQLCTLADFFRRRFGRSVELAYVLMSVTYFGWIAAQMVAAGEILQAYFDFDLTLLICIFGLVATVYTVTGGLWAVTITDSIQVVVLLIGIVAVFILTLLSPDFTWSTIPSSHLSLFSAERGLLDVTYMVFLGTFGTLAGNELMQRISACRSPEVARRSSLVAGLLYLVIGSIPVCLALMAAGSPNMRGEGDIIVRIVQTLEQPILQMVLVISLLSAVLSTIDSALLSVSSLISENLFPKRDSNTHDSIRFAQKTVVIVAGISIGIACIGESAYGLIHFSYAMSLCGAFIPLTFGLFWKRGTTRSAIASIGIGLCGWIADVFVADPPFHIPLVTFILAVSTYVALALLEHRPKVARS